MPPTRFGINPKNCSSDSKDLFNPGSLQHFLQLALL